MVLTQEYVEGKLEEVDLHRKGKGHAKGSKNLYERIQGRSSTIGKIQREAISTNCKRCEGLPTVRSIIGVSCFPSKANRHFLGVVTKLHKKRKFAT
jgi:hypothetical protein